VQRPAVITRLGAVVAATLIGAGLLAGTASAEIRHSTGMHNDRYCEIFELKGVPPVSTVDVWNTIGLNYCPPEWWDNLDTTKIAAENGDTLVLKNGPRHWLMDSARGDVGGVKTFESQQLRHVATIPLKSPADLQQTPYTERTIARTNTWHWKQHRRVYELVNPEGVHYLMQSYSQIVDPELKASDLATLGERLELPEGWRYKMRRLHKPLTMRAEGSATILQDNLKNTYQLEVPEPRGKRRTVAVKGMTKLAGMSSPGVLHDQGTITGKPFGAGTIDILVSFKGQGKASGTFTIGTERGNAYGTVDMSFVISGGEIDFTGTADFTSGTGRYRHITGMDLAAHDHNTLDGQNGRVTLDGFVRF
jgi:hypothetical protein